MKRIQYFLKSFAGTFFFILILFISAGRIDFYQGWVFSVLSLFGLLMSFVISSGADDLLEERSKPPTDAKNWDKHILKLSALMTLAAYIIAGMDSGRYHWSDHIHWETCSIGVILTLSGQLFFLAAKKINRYFSSVVRIQHDRGQIVCESGPYRYVRHPGYLGMILSWTGFPLLLDSRWSIFPVGLSILLLLVRTRLEDRTLIEELPGYSNYILTTRYKLVPGIW